LIETIISISGNKTLVYDFLSNWVLSLMLMEMLDSSGGSGRSWEGAAQAIGESDWLLC
jgi:hypothetical protein